MPLLLVLLLLLWLHQTECRGSPPEHCQPPMQHLEPLLTALLLAAIVGGCFLGVTPCDLQPQKGRAAAGGGARDRPATCSAGPRVEAVTGAGAASQPAPACERGITSSAASQARNQHILRPSRHQTVGVSIGLASTAHESQSRFLLESIVNDPCCVQMYQCSPSETDQRQSIACICGQWMAPFLIGISTWNSLSSERI